MSLLRDLLGVQDPEFSASLRQLELASNQQGIDLRLVGEIHQKVASVVKRLGLDSKDTTGPELYYCMSAKARNLDQRLLAGVGIDRFTDVDKAAKLIKGLTLSFARNDNCWVLRKSVIKDILREMPPVKAMKFLGYRSVVSMLKRHDLAEILLAAYRLEDMLWLQKLGEAYHKVNPKDFEPRQIEISILPRERWDAEVWQVIGLKELGQVLIAPSELRPGAVLWVLSQLALAVNDIRQFSAYTKLHQVKGDFGKIVANALQSEVKTNSALAGHDLEWRTLHRYLCSLKEHPTQFEPHLQPDDLRWHKFDDVLAKVVPEIGHWHGLEFVGAIYEERPISFNLADVAEASYLDVPYEQRSNTHLRNALKDELFSRYLCQKTLHEQMLNSL
jgi:hypothetical protein